MGSTGFETGTFFTFWYKHYDRELTLKLENDNTNAVIAEIMIKTDENDKTIEWNSDALKSAVITILEKNGKELFKEYNKQYLEMFGVNKNV